MSTVMHTRERLLLKLMFGMVHTMNQTSLHRKHIFQVALLLRLENPVPTHVRHTLGAPWRKKSPSAVSVCEKERSR